MFILTVRQIRSVEKQSITVLDYHAHRKYTSQLGNWVFGGEFGDAVDGDGAVAKNVSFLMLVVFFWVLVVVLLLLRNILCCFVGGGRGGDCGGVGGDCDGVDVSGHEDVSVGAGEGGDRAVRVGVGGGRVFTRRGGHDTGSNSPEDS